jgi:hypothetical protein
VLRAEVEHAFQYISEENERVWLPAFRDTVRLRYHPLAELRRNHHPYDLLRAVKYTAGFALGRLRGRGALLDDPYAVFAAPWLARRVGCRVVVTVRDPVATVSSWRRLGWTPRLAELLAQPALVRDRLGRFAPELEAALADGTDGVERAGLLWRVIYGAVAGYRAEIPGLEVVRHEDLSAHPVRPLQPCTGGSGCRSGPRPSGRSWPRPRPGRAAGRCPGRCRPAGCPRRPPAAWTAGPTSRCGARATPTTGWPGPACGCRRRR